MPWIALPIAARPRKKSAVRCAKEREPAKLDRHMHRLNLQFNATWQGREYEIKQVAPVVVETPDEIVVVTVYYLLLLKSDPRHVMRITYDEQTDAMYIRLVDRLCECRNLRLSEEVTLDLGPGELLVGIEILDAKRLLGNGQLPQLVVDHLPVEAA